MKDDSECGTNVRLNELLGVRARLKSGDYDGVDVMSAWIAIDELIAAQAEIERLRDALSAIADWRMPLSGHFWDEPENTKPMSYAAAFGSNGERDVIRSIARAALLTPNT